VYRHDPGGWYMIAPPEGSFSYIRTEYVNRAGGNRGVVTSNNVVVRVGSSFGDTHDVEQRRLSTGDEVEIISEKTLLSDRGPVRMFVIKPPKGEYRWVAGQSVVPADGGTGRQPARSINDSIQRSPAYDPNLPNKPDPFDKSSYPVADQNKGKSGLQERPVVRTGSAVQRSTPPVDEIEADRQRLELLDVRFRTIINQEIPNWDFERLEQDYVQLKNEISRPAFLSQLDLRLQALDRYQKVKYEYDEFIRITRETEKRDAQLLAIQRQGTAATATSSATSVPQPANSQTRPPSVPAGASPSSVNTARTVPRFDGAGIVQRSATTFPGAPRHVLLAPNGRILAYLQGEPGVNLDQFAGRSAGIYGKRSFRADLQTDFILVRQLAPVQLKP
jgi:hypothetical protein